MVFEFVSTSKISFAGAGIAAMASSKANLDDARKSLVIQTIGYDKVNQLRHVRFFKNLDGVKAHMEKHAALLRPRFELVLRTLEENLKGTGAEPGPSPRADTSLPLRLWKAALPESWSWQKRPGLFSLPRDLRSPMERIRRMPSSGLLRPIRRWRSWIRQGRSLSSARSWRQWRSFWLNKTHMEIPCTVSDVSTGDSNYAIHWIYFSFIDIFLYEVF